MGTVKRTPELPPNQLDEEQGEVPDSFGQLQREDPTLQAAFRKVTHVNDVQTEVQPSLSGEGYVIRDGLLYHQTGMGGAEQLVVPEQFRNRVLAMGHKIPWAGHLSNNKSFGRVAARFCWPGLYSDLLASCKSCVESQLTSKRKASPYPLQPLPVIEVPFTRIDTDTPWYPEAFTLRKVRHARLVAAVLQGGDPPGSPD